MVEGFTGLPGSGKTYYLAKLGIEALKDGRQVYANFKLEGAQYFQDLSEVFSVRKGVILVDEINLVCASRFWNKFPPELAYFWSQTRKMELDIYWTAQHIDRVDKIVREISNWVWYLRWFGLRNKKNSDYKTTFFYRARCYLPEQINKEKKQVFDSRYFRTKKEIYSKYNTYEMIALPDYLTKENKKLR